jgi:hypothetical protein
MFDQRQPLAVPQPCQRGLIIQREGVGPSQRQGNALRVVQQHVARFARQTHRLLQALVQFAGRVVQQLQQAVRRFGGTVHGA